MINASKTHEELSFTWFMHTTYRNIMHRNITLLEERVDNKQGHLFHQHLG